MKKRIGFGHMLQDFTATTAGHAPNSTSMTSIAFAAGPADDLPDRGAAAAFSAGR